MVWIIDLPTSSYHLPILRRISSPSSQIHKLIQKKQMQIFENESLGKYRLENEWWQTAIFVEILVRNSQANSEEVTHETIWISRAIGQCLRWAWVFEFLGDPPVTSLNAESILGILQFIGNSTTFSKFSVLLSSNTRPANITVRKLDTTYRTPSRTLYTPIAVQPKKKNKAN